MNYAYIVKPNSVVMFRRISTKYEPLTTTSIIPYLFTDKDVMVHPDRLDEYVPGLLSYEWASCGYYVFVLSELNELNNLDKLLLVVHRESVEEVAG